MKVTLAVKRKMEQRHRNVPYTLEQVAHAFKNKIYLKKNQRAGQGLFQGKDKRE
jgi:hypothetical protein